MSRRKMLVLTVALIALVVLVVVEPALAQSQVQDAGNSGGKAGKNLAKMFRDWGTALLFGVGVLVGLPALAKREIGQSVVILVIILLVGGLAYADDKVIDLIKAIWTSL
jgi:hypothetical protein